MKIQVQRCFGVLQKNAQRPIANLWFTISKCLTLKFGTLLLVGCSFLFLVAACKQPYEQTQKEFIVLKSNFVEAFPNLAIPSLTLSYVTNLKNIQSLDSIEQQLVFFNDLQQQLEKIDPAYLVGDLRMEKQILDFECRLNLERLALEKAYRTSEDQRPIDEKGLYFNPKGKAWYAYFIKRWIGTDITPDELMALGKEEVRQVQREIQGVQAALGYAKDSIGFYEHLNDKKFFEPDSNKVMEGFQERKKIVRTKLWQNFEKWDLPDEKIAMGKLAQLSHVPGFYRSQEWTFYFNLFDRPYNTRQYDWLYIHEAVPGHHFQIALINQHTDSLSELNGLFRYPGYVEGWAAYTEELGVELGLYRTPYDWMGKHEWNIVRSVRVVLDVGINYLGWSDEKALSYWKANIVNQDQIAMREIKRMQNWPGQVHTYKYGAAQILKYKEALLEREGADFSIKSFHRQILNKGPMPWNVLEEMVLGEE